MGRTYDGVSEKLGAWLEAQPVFFVATAPLDAGGSMNCSPKGNRGELRVLDGHTVAYVEQTGSGIETLAHLGENGRMVMMFCAFSGPPRIVRLHGSGGAALRGSPEFAEQAADWPAAGGVGVRSIVTLSVRRVADSCGYGVPLMTFEGHRPALDHWAERKGEAGIGDYWAEKNAVSVDGLPGLGG